VASGQLEITTDQILGHSRLKIEKSNPSAQSTRQPPSGLCFLQIDYSAVLALDASECAPNSVVCGRIRRVDGQFFLEFRDRFRRWVCHRRLANPT